MGRRTGKRAVRRWGAVVASATLVVALMATAPAALAKKPASKPKPKPDLTVSSRTLRSKGLYVLQNEHDPNLSLEDTTTNAGKAPAGRTVTKVYLEHGGKRWLLGQREVPPLRPGQDDSGSDLVVHDMNFPLGAYTVEFCADANHRYREENRKAQCRLAGTEDFTVVAQRWVGSVNGEYDAILGNVERWTSSDADLVMAAEEGVGLFRYDFRGTVTWTDSGTDEDGCVWSGSGSHTFTQADQPVGSLSIDYKHEEFTGAFAIAQEIYKSNIACPNGADSTGSAPQSPGIFSSGLGGPAPFPFGSTSLPGSGAHGLLGTSFSWDLRPAGP